MMVEDLDKTENWVHTTPHILKAGRIDHQKPIRPTGISEEEDWNEDDALGKIKEEDPYVNRLTPISNDETFNGISADTSGEEGEKPSVAWLHKI